MKFLSFSHEGRQSYGFVEGASHVRDLGAVLHDQAPDLKSFIAGGLMAGPSPAGRKDAPLLDLDAVRFLPVIPNPGKIICIGLNYAAHVQETGRQVTEDPTFFVRLPESQTAHREAIMRPPESECLDYEGEIAVIIGTGGRRIAEASAWQHVAGYACYNDGSVRDWQARTSQWTSGKNFWHTGGFGPWMVTSDEIAPGQEMTLVTRLNGQEMQRTTTRMMIHSIPRQIAFISTVVPLAAGDVIVTGTPGGIGNKRDPKVFMKHGDVVEVEVDAIGILRNVVRDEFREQ